MFPIPNTFGVFAAARQFKRVIAPCVVAEPCFVLGQGSNVLPVTFFEGTLVQIGGSSWRHWHAAGQWLVEADAGLEWHALVEALVAHGIGGIENLALIPGTVGAAPVQNIGAYGLEIGERVVAVEGFDRRSGEPFQWSASDCRFGYRSSAFKEGDGRTRVITRVRLALPDPWQPCLSYAPLRARLDVHAHAALSPQRIFDVVCAVRNEKLPDWRTLGNAGSFFKNPLVSKEQAQALLAEEPGMVHFAAGDEVKLAAGWLIDRCGLKGQTLGRAAVHCQQALVLVNQGGASAGDILALARLVRERVLARFGVLLEPEVRFLGRHGEVSFDEAFDLCNE